MKSISKAANSRGVSWTIGSWPNANSNTGWFCVRRRARRELRAEISPCRLTYLINP